MTTDNAAMRLDERDPPSVSRFDSDVPFHRPQPTPWQWQDLGDENWTIRRYLYCRFCRRPIQRRGLLRRWRHVVARFLPGLALPAYHSLAGRGAWQCETCKGIFYPEYAPPTICPYCCDDVQGAAYELGRRQ